VDAAKRDAGAVAIFPGAGNDVKEWGASNYKALVDRLEKDSRVRHINIYVADRVEALPFATSASQKLHVHAGLDFNGLSRSLAGNAVCVANNSFGAHLGAYLGVTVVGIYAGHETVTEWAPVFGESFVIHADAHCSPCHIAKRADCAFAMNCLADISVDFVYAKISEAIDSTSRAPSESQARPASSISTGSGQPDMLEELIASINGLYAAGDRSQDYAGIAVALSRNHPLRGQSRQLLLDISELVRVDAKSGIQRVVRALLKELLTHPPEGVRVEPVYASSETPGYRYARAFTRKFLGLPADDAYDHPAEAWNGDVLFGLDLQPYVVAAQKEHLLEWHRRGVKISFFVQDLLPISMPACFPEGAAAGHQRWLETISCFDGAVCGSRAAADTLLEWLEVFGAPRQRPFELSWSHHGADLASSVPSYGMPEGAGRVIDALAASTSFLMVGTLEPRKGHAQALAAFEQLWQNDLPVKLVIVGKQGWMVDSLVERLRAHPENGRRLYWLEAISDEYLERVYGASACLLAASEGEGFGLPLIEAAQHKLPVIARDIPVFREVAGGHAFFFPDEKSPQVLAQALQEWLALHDAGTHPRSDGMRSLTWQQSAQELKRQLFEAEPYKTWLPDGVRRYWGNDPRLHTDVGERAGRAMRAAGRDGCLIHGPYAALPAGRYRIVLRGTAARWAGGEWLDLVSDGGRQQLSYFGMSSLPKDGDSWHAEFALADSVADFEFRVFVQQDTQLDVEAIELTSLEPA